MCRWVHAKILVVHKFSKLNLERDRAQSARRRVIFKLSYLVQELDELDFVFEGIVYETQRDGEGPSSVAHVPPRRRANTSSSVVLARCRGRSLFWWSGVGVVLSVALALLVALAFCSISVAVPTELALVNEWVEGGGLLVSGRRRVFFVRFVLCVAAMLYFFV